MASDLSSTFVITIIAISFLSLAPIHPVLAKNPCQFPAIFNFGDSNSDTGGLSAAFGQAPPPNGLSYFGSPAGRYCDGRLLIDFIAESLGLPYLSAFLDSVGTNFSHGANFATAASTIRPQNITLSRGGFSPISLNVQFYEFNDFHKRSQVVRKRGGVFETLMPKKEHFSSALYTFDIGQNDLTAGYFSNMSTDQVKAYVPDVLNQFQTIIQAGPVGCLPYMMDRIPVLASQIDVHGCATPFNDVAQFFNQGLKKTVERLRKDLVDAAITYVDVYSLKYSLISQGRKHGFKKPLRSCCGHGGKYNYNKNLGCGAKVNKHGKEVWVGAACEDPSSAVIWDGIHFTQAANKYIFEGIVDGSFSDPPTPLNMACYRN
ncbi:hypothetical protein V6N13_017430 [Hibiscus sabdariffa]|uniref:Alpha-L-fucosidase n=1 Tax=Hibiscus sabdariffa TaxID=183260 RepID=A0ABR2CZE1_9ROSI